MKNVMTARRLALSLLLLLLVAVPRLQAVEGDEAFRLLIDDVEFVKAEDRDAALAYQNLLVEKVKSMGRFDLITRESVAEKVGIKAKVEAGLEVSDADMAKAARLAGGKYLLRARLSEVKRAYTSLERDPRKTVESSLTVRLIDIETVTAVGVLRYKLLGDEGVLGARDYPRILEDTYREFKAKLDFDLKGMMLLKTDVADASGTVFDIPIGQNVGVKPLTRFLLYRNERIQMEDEYGEKNLEIVRKPAGTLRVIQVASNRSRIEMTSVRLGRIGKDMTAIEWNLRNVRTEIQSGLTTFSASIPKKTIQAKDIAGSGSATNYYILVEGTENAAYQNSMINLGGGNRLSPFVNFDVGWSPGKIELFGRINLVLTSPLLSATLDPGIKIHLIESGIFNLTFAFTGKIGFLGGRVGSIQFPSGFQPLGNVASDNALTSGGSLPLGSLVTMANLVYGASGQVQAGFNVKDASRFGFVFGYDWMPDQKPNFFVDVPSTILTAASSKAVPASVASSLYSGNLSLSRFVFGVSYSSLF